MACPVIFAPSARRDVENIVQYIAEDSPERAAEYGRFLADSVRRLGEFPLMGRTIRDTDLPGYREIIVRAYRVIYRLRADPERVEIMRFWHSARGTPWLTFGEE